MARRRGALWLGWLLISVVTACSGHGEPNPAAASSNVRPYSQLSLDARRQRLSDCKELQTLYGQWLSSLTAVEAAPDDATRVLTELRAKLPPDLRGDLSTVVSARSDAVDDARRTANHSGPTGTATERLERYISAMCDIRS